MRFFCSLSNGSHAPINCWIESEMSVESNFEWIKMYALLLHLTSKTVYDTENIMDLMEYILYLYMLRRERVDTFFIMIRQTEKELFYEFRRRIFDLLQIFCHSIGFLFYVSQHFFIWSIVVRLPVCTFAFIFSHFSFHFFVHDVFSLYIKVYLSFPLCWIYFCKRISSRHVAHFNIYNRGE